MNTLEITLAARGLQLENGPTPIAEYVSLKRCGNLVYISGCDCRKNGNLIYSGKLGKDLTIAEGKAAAEQSAVNILSVLNRELDGFSQIKQLVKMLAFVNSTDNFDQQPLVVNGASELFVAVFGDKGKHARSAIGTNSLPFNTPIEIELIVELYE